MPSLQHPRKITIIGSDGRDYIFLCKPKDDLRKDSRTMEFNGIMNRLLTKDRNARARCLGNTKKINVFAKVNVFVCHIPLVFSVTDKTSAV